MQGLIHVRYAAGGGGIVPPWKFGAPLGILPGKFLKYDSFFICIAFSVNFEGYSVICCWPGCSNVVLLLQNVHF